MVETTEGREEGMAFVLLDRQAGKTEALLSWLMEAPENEHRVLVSHTLMESHRVMRYARVERQLPLESWQFVSVSEVREPGAWSGVLMGRGGRIVLGLDNIDLILPALFGREVAIVTATATLRSTSRDSEVREAGDVLWAWHIASPHDPAGAPAGWTLAPKPMSRDSEVREAIEALRSLSDAATPGRWYHLIDDYERGEMFLTHEAVLNDAQTPLAVGLSLNDAHLIAAAVNTLRAILDRSSEAAPTPQKDAP